MKKWMERISFWIQILGLAGLLVILFICFQGKDDSTFERLVRIGIVAAIMVFVISCAVSSHFKSAGIQFLLCAAVCIGICIFAMSEGYGSGEAKDCGTYRFTAVKYWQEKHVTRVRYRLTTHLVNYVKYQGELDNGEEVVYKCTTSSIGDAMGLVRRGDTTKRQVFAYNGNYYTKEAGASPEEFLLDFLKWKNILFVSAGVYGALGILLVGIGIRHD